MSKISIDFYRGWEIFFDTDEEKFLAMSEDYNRQETRGSFAAAKKWVDDFLKENEKFVPFDVHTWSGGRRGPTLKVIGLRKDGRPATEDADGNKGQIGSYHYSGEYILLNPANAPVFAEIEAYDAETERIEQEREKGREPLIAKVVVMTMDDHLKSMKK